eukprot:g4260.t1
MDTKDDKSWNFVGTNVIAPERPNYITQPDTKRIVESLSPFPGQYEKAGLGKENEQESKMKRKRNTAKGNRKGNNVRSRGEVKRDREEDSEDEDEYFSEGEGEQKSVEESSGALKLSRKRQGFLKVTRRKLESHLEKHPLDAKAWFQLGSVLLEQEEFSLSNSKFDEAIQLGMDTPEVCLKALKALYSLVSMHVSSTPGYDDLDHTNCANWYRSSQRMQFLIEKAFKHKSSSRDVDFQMICGAYHKWKGNFSEASAHLKLALDLFQAPSKKPTSSFSITLSKLQYDYSTALFHNKNYSECILMLRSMNHSEPSIEKMLTDCLRARAYECSGEPMLALEYMNQCYSILSLDGSLDEDKLKCWSRIAEESITRGNFHTALDALFQCHRRFPNDQTTIEALAKIHARLGHFDSSLRIIKGLEEKDINVYKAAEFWETKLEIINAGNEEKEMKISDSQLSTPVVASTDRNTNTEEAKDIQETEPMPKPEKNVSKVKSEQRETRRRKGKDETTSNYDNASVNFQQEMEELRTIVMQQRAIIDSQNSKIDAMHSALKYKSSNTEQMEKESSVITNELADTLVSKLEDMELRVEHKLEENRNTLSTMIDRVHAQIPKGGNLDFIEEVGKIAEQHMNNTEHHSEEDLWTIRSRQRLAKVASLAASATSKLATVLSGGSLVEDYHEQQENENSSQEHKSSLLSMYNNQSPREIVGTMKDQKLVDEGADSQDKKSKDEDNIHSGVTEQVDAKHSIQPRSRRRDMMALRRVFDSLRQDEQGRVNKAQLVMALEKDDEIQALLIEKSYSIITPL